MRSEIEINHDWIEWAESGRWFMIFQCNWAPLFHIRPDLIFKWPPELLSGLEWSSAVCADISLKEHCPFELFDGRNWVDCLCEHPCVFDEECDWGKLDKTCWVSLLQERPECFRPAVKTLFDADDRASIIGRQPSLADELNFESLPFYLRLQVLASTSKLDSRMDWNDSPETMPDNSEESYLLLSSWAELLGKRPEFAARCTCRESFTGSDWVQIIASQNILDEYCRWEKIDPNVPYGWPYLLDERPELATRCPWDLMIVKDVEEFLRNHPEYRSSVPEKLHALVSSDNAEEFTADMDGYEWAEYLTANPGAADKCPFDTFDGTDWAAVLASHPEFADRCPWHTLNSSNWSDLLAEQPEFADRCPWDSFDNDDWVEILKLNSEFADKCPLDILTGKNWRWILTNSPELANKCDWEKLDGTDWAQLLMFQPQFAKYCSWHKLDNDNWMNLLDRRPEFSRQCPKKYRGISPEWLWKARLEWCDKMHIGVHSQEIEMVETGEQVNE